MLALVSLNWDLKQEVFLGSSVTHVKGAKNKHWEYTKVLMRTWSKKLSCRRVGISYLKRRTGSFGQAPRRGLHCSTLQSWRQYIKLPTPNGEGLHGRMQASVCWVYGQRCHERRSEGSTHQSRDLKDDLLVQMINLWSPKKYDMWSGLPLMRYSASEKLEIIWLAEESHL